MEKLQHLSSGQHFGTLEEMNTFLSSLAVFIWLLLIAGCITHIFMSAGYYAVAKRRGIGKAWLSWIPIGQFWILGSISDQYQLEINYRTRNKRKMLLYLQVVLVVLLVLMLIVAATTVLAAIGTAENQSQFPFIDFMKPVRDGLRDMLWLYYVILAISLAVLIIHYFALFDLYRSCCPDHSVLFLMLSMFIPVVTSFLVFGVRKKDQGMR